MSKGRTRAGTQLLLMAADPVKRRILREIVERPLAAGDDQEYRVTASGREALFVGFVVDRWLQCAPQGPLPFEGREAGRAVAALAESWSTAVMHALAHRSLSIDGLHSGIGLNTRQLERQLAAMHEAGQVEERTGADGVLTYSITNWLRAGIAPLIASARLERRHPNEGMAPIDALDVEAGFRCSLPLLRLPKQLSGTCGLGINLEDDGSGSLTGVTTQIEQGQVVSTTSGLERVADAWAAGTVSDWLDTVIEPETERVRTGNDRWLTSALLDSLHRVLFGIPTL